MASQLAFHCNAFGMQFLCCISSCTHTDYSNTHITMSWQMTVRGANGLGAVRSWCHNRHNHSICAPLSQVEKRPWETRISTATTSDRDASDSFVAWDDALLIAWLLALLTEIIMYNWMKANSREYYYRNCTPSFDNRPSQIIAVGLLKWFVAEES